MGGSGIETKGYRSGNLVRQWKKQKEASVSPATRPPPRGGQAWRGRSKMKGSYIKLPGLDEGQSRYPLRNLVTGMRKNRKKDEDRTPVCCRKQLMGEHIRGERAKAFFGVF